MRRTGQTFRLLLQAMISVSEGHDVCVVTGTADHAQTLERSVFRAAAELGLRFEIQGKKLTLKDNGKHIFFMSHMQALYKDWKGSSKYIFHYDTSTRGLRG